MKTRLKIGDFSKLAHVTVKTLRYYDDVGLLKAVYVDADTGYRYYESWQLWQVQRILLLRGIGLSIDNILRIQHGESADEILIAQRRVLVENLSQTQQALHKIDLLIQHKEDTMMSYQPETKIIPSYIVFYRRGVIPSFKEMTSFILEAGENCRHANPGLKCIPEDYCYCSYLDPEFCDTNIQLEYAQAVERAGIETDMVKFRKIPSVEAICVCHKGPYDRLGAAYSFIFEYLKSMNLKPVEPPREVYIDGIWNKENPEDWLTEIQVPVKMIS